MFDVTPVEIGIPVPVNVAEGARIGSVDVTVPPVVTPSSTCEFAVMVVADPASGI